MDKCKDLSEFDEGPNCDGIVKVRGRNSGELETGSWAVKVGNVVGHENIFSALRMNSAIVVFLNDVEKVRKLTQNGIVVNNETILVSPLSSPAKKVMLSNVPPFISDEAIGKELSRYGRMVSPIKKIPLGYIHSLSTTSPIYSRVTRSLCQSGVIGHQGRIHPGLSANPSQGEETPEAQGEHANSTHMAEAGIEPPTLEACPERQSDPGVSERPGQAEGPGAAAVPDLTESEPRAQPAAQKPTGAMPAPEKPHTAGLAAAEPRSARPDRKKPWSTEKSSVGSGAVLEPPALTEVGTEVQGNRMETPDTTPVQGDGGVSDDE
ncbi:hypothetical protein QTP70_009532 [Hemibagrus guttatus]|uniref:Uncharacterized protein n=1 Tax=Hemibagrus guttatus TaxID=175788 RepID=A0AAE0RJM3_9TELE|nr:hypothetical protein QTP70_009532 [Hemibagrus guttatus]